MVQIVVELIGLHKKNLKVNVPENEDLRRCQGTKDLSFQVYRTEKLPKFYSLPTPTPKKFRYGEGYYSIMMTYNNNMVKNLLNI